MWKYSISAVHQNQIEIIGHEKKNVDDRIKKWMSMTPLLSRQLDMAYYITPVNTLNPVISIVQVRMEPGNPSMSLQLQHRAANTL